MLWTLPSSKVSQDLQCPAGTFCSSQTSGSRWGGLCREFSESDKSVRLAVSFCSVDDRENLPGSVIYRASGLGLLWLGYFLNFILCHNAAVLLVGRAREKHIFTAQRSATAAGAVLSTLSPHCKSSLVFRAREIKAYDRDLPKKYTNGASKSIIPSFLADVSVCMFYISAKNV